MKNNVERVIDFYASPMNYDNTDGMSLIEMDKGQLARTTLDNYNVTRPQAHVLMYYGYEERYSNRVCGLPIILIERGEFAREYQRGGD